MRIALAFIALLLIGCRTQPGAGPSATAAETAELSSVVFDELWFRFFELPPEYALADSNEVIGIKVTREEYLTPADWMVHSREASGDDFYYLRTTEGAYSCFTHAGPPRCETDPLGVPGPQRASQPAAEPRSSAEQRYAAYMAPYEALFTRGNPERMHNFQTTSFFTLKGLVESLRYGRSSYRESVDTVAITKTAYADSTGRYECYAFSLYNTVNEQVLAELDKQTRRPGQQAQLSSAQQAELARMKAILGNPQERFRVCFNAQNIVTHDSREDNPDNAYNTLDFFSPRVDNRSVFDLPFPLNVGLADVEGANNVSVCHEIDDRHDRGLCVITVAVALKDPTLCTTIKEIDTTTWLYAKCLSRFLDDSRAKLVPCAGNVQCHSGICLDIDLCLTPDCTNRMSTFQEDPECYPFCPADDDCGFPGAGIIRPRCGNYTVGSDSGKNYSLCV